MRPLCLSLALLLLSGCGGSANAPNTTAANPVAPNGAEDEGVPEGNVEPEPEDGDGEESGSIIGRTTDKIVDLKAALEENPELTILERKLSAKDPLTQAGSVYQSAAAFAGSLPLVQWLQQEKALNDRYPSHPQLVDWMKKNNVELPLLAPWLTYAYNAETGEIVVLEDKKDKAQRLGR